MIDLKKYIFSIIFVVIMVLLTGFNVLLFTGCNTFEPIKIEGQPQQCNDLYTLMDFSSRMTGVFSKENTSAATALTLMTLSYNKCNEAREDFKKQKRFNDCVKIIYGPELLPKQKNYKQYADFIDCRDK